MCVCVSVCVCARARVCAVAGSDDFLTLGARAVTNSNNGVTCEWSGGEMAHVLRALAKFFPITVSHADASMHDDIARTCEETIGCSKQGH